MFAVRRGVGAFLLLWVFTVLPGTSVFAGFGVEPYQVEPGEEITVSYDGAALRGHGQVFIHYGYNGWLLDHSGSQRDGAAVFSDAPMKFDRGCECYRAVIMVPAGARAMHMVFVGRDELGNQLWDNNGGKDYSWPVFFPYIGPYLTWNGETRPDDGVVISFVHSVAAAASLEYWPDCGEPRVLQSARGRYHHFVLTGMEPATRYSYRVKAKRNFSSATYSFTTAASSHDDRGVTFAVIGDAQANGISGHFARTISALVNDHHDIDFVMAPGDLAHNDNSAAWWLFFDKARDLLASRVFMPVPGNHDSPGNGSSTDQDSFLAYFPLDYAGGGAAGDAHHSFEYGNLKFFGLNSERMAEFQAGDGRQYQWLETQLQDRRDQLARSAEAGKFWTFAYWHNPPFNLGTRHFGEQFSSRAVAGLFGGVVDWCFGGHEHIYHRSKPLVFIDQEPASRRVYGTAAGGGTGYMVVPPAGSYLHDAIIGEDHELSRYRDFLAYPELKDGSTTLPSGRGFLKLHVRSNRITIQGFGRVSRDGGTGFSVVDELQYDK